MQIAQQSRVGVHCFFTIRHWYSRSRLWT